uniref:NADH-ubiquinone oxidoreductase chain 2 n=1 Tax=Cicadetta abscondita TaxID=2593298 RepID=A0A7S6ZPH9_9HEMI|nr:NADH dehydrogenase subunit 2 [Cicadetta abscondita]QOW07738.1 NADH dehydrogenase subunit 2 [Cicadetta abscondita]
MKNNSSYLLYLIFLFMGIMISISSNNWLGCWMGIEMNMVSFLPVMANKMSIYASESMIKYFIVQSMGSSLLLISIIINMMIDFNYMIMISLMIKIGCPPFHFWYVSVIEGLSWMVCFILMTIQKIIPLIMLSYLDVDMSLFVIMACIWGCIGGLGYSSMRKIIAYSSIYNLSWIFSGIMIINYSWLIYYFIYSFTLMAVCYMFNMFNINYINQFIMISYDFLKSLMMMCIFMSMGGLPPFLGFFPKLIMINCLLLNNMLFICTILLMTALIVLFFYLRILITTLMMNTISMKMIIVSISYFYYIAGLFSLFGMILLSLITLTMC